MRKWFTALALFLAFALYGQEPDIYSVFEDIRPGLLHNSPAHFYLDCTPLSKLSLIGDAFFIQRDSIHKYLDSSEVDFLFTFINVPKYPYDEYRTRDTSFSYLPITAFNVAKFKGAICANDTIRTNIFLANAFTPQHTGEAGKKERSDYEARMKLQDKRWDNEIYSFSAPFFNTKRTVFLIAAFYTKGMFDAHGTTYLYKKVNGRWIQIMWLSTYAP